MCYLPLPLLKFWVGIGSGISVVLSLGLLVSVFYVKFAHGSIIDNSNEPIIKYMFVLLFISSIIFFLLALGGLFGTIKAKRKNKLAPCLLSAYFVSVIIFFVGFVALTITIFAAPPTIFGESCQKGSTTKLIENIYNLSQEGYENFCTENCPCALKADNYNTTLGIWLSQNGKVIDENPKSQKKSYQFCMGQNSDKGNAVLLGTIQDILQCTGWCENDAFRFKRFSDINNCVTQDCLENSNPCYDQFKDFVYSKGTFLGISTSILSAFLLINMIFICCICLHPTTRSQKAKNFYARMMQSSD